ncbi:hypothetical protein N0V82_007766 [Gnomoniopsis sp. IMI 355080]|nr:hypothetical protein N0V82_007766 [Gnomoniopsis sp. IMI 355080]
MSQWILQQYSALKGEASAELNAIGSLAAIKCRHFGLYGRNRIHDAQYLSFYIMSSFQDRPLVAWATFLALAVSTTFILDRLFARFFSTQRKLGLPALRMRKGWDYATLLQEGSKRYPNSPYIITYSGYEYVVFPSTSFDEIKRLKASRASMVDWFTTVFWQGWHFLGIDNSARYHTVGIDLARALPSRVWMRQENARAAFDTVLGPLGTNEEWKDVSLWKTVQKIVVLMNAMALFGPELGSDPRWLRATERLHLAIMFGIVGSHLTPRVLRPLVAPLIFLPAKLVDWHMASLLRPMVQRDMANYPSTAHGKKRPTNGTISSADLSSPRDGSSNSTHESVPKRFPLTTWLLDRYRSQHKSLDHLLRDHIVIAFEAATSTAGIVYFLLAELAEPPELAQELREEVAQNMDPEGHLPLSYLSELRKMDSFMLEVARVTGSSHLALFRRIQRHLQLSIGPELAPGTLICVDAYHAAKSHKKDENVANFDPMRFYKMRQHPGHEDLHQFTLPGPENTFWGGGTQACPGRPFAAVTIKVDIRFGCQAHLHMSLLIMEEDTEIVWTGLPRDWPDRLLHVPSMTSYKCEITEGPDGGARYGEWLQPRYYALSYTWGRWELGEHESPEVEALPVKNIPWAVPRINPARFTATQFEQVLQNITANTVRIPEATSWATPEFVWLDVACIDQRPGSPLKAQEIGRQAVIFRGAEAVFVWLHGIEPTVLYEALDGLFKASSDSVFPHSPRSDGIRKRGEVLRGDEAFLSAAVTSLDSLLADPWFSSLWTLQEAFLSPTSGLVAKDGGIPAVFDTHISLNDVTRYCAGLVDICSRSAAIKKKPAPLEQVLMNLVERSGLVAMNQRNPMSLYTLASERTTRDPCDRIYGIMQVFGFRLGSSAEGAEPDAAFSLLQLETQLGESLLKDLPLLSQVAIHTKLLPVGQAWRVHRSSVMPDLARELPYYHTSSLFGRFEPRCSLSSVTRNGITWARFDGYTLPFERLMGVCRSVNEAGLYRYRDTHLGTLSSSVGASCFQLALDVSEATLRNTYLSARKLWQIPLQKPTAAQGGLGIAERMWRYPRTNTGAAARAVLGREEGHVGLWEDQER